jgi:hypothetical protein
MVLSHSITMGLDTQRLGYPPLAEGWLYYLLLVLKELGIFVVPTFLFVSGCFFSYAAQGSNPPSLSWKVVRTGLRRLLWPYLFWSVAFYMLIYFRWDVAYTPLGYLKNLLVGYPFHFIPLIAFYYLLSPFLVRFARRFGLALIVIIGLYQLLLINIVYPGTLGVFFPDWMHIFAPPVLRTTLALWAIYFPLGLVYNINAKQMLPRLQRARWAFLIITAVLFVISLLDVFSVIRFPLASFICPTTFVLVSTTIRRESIPKVRTLEKLGKKSYGLYLTNLLFMDLVLFGIHLFVPRLFSYPVLLPPILFALTMGVALATMNGFTRLPARTMYRYVFG